MLSFIPINLPFIMSHQQSNAAYQLTSQHKNRLGNDTQPIELIDALMMPPRRMLQIAQVVHKILRD